MAGQYLVQTVESHDPQTPPTPLTSHGASAATSLPPSHALAPGATGSLPESAGPSQPQHNHAQSLPCVTPAWQLQACKRRLLKIFPNMPAKDAHEVAVTASLAREFRMTDVLSHHLLANYTRYYQRLDRSQANEASDKRWKLEECGDDERSRQQEMFEGVKPVLRNVLFRWVKDMRSERSAAILADLGLNDAAPQSAETQRVVSAIWTSFPRLEDDIFIIAKYFHG